MSTIAAISTGRAPGGIGVVRISGEDAIEIGDKIFSSFGANLLCSKQIKSPDRFSLSGFTIV